MPSLLEKQTNILMTEFGDRFWSKKKKKGQECPTHLTTLTYAMSQNSRHTNEQSKVSLINTFQGLHFMCIKAEIHKLTVCILPEVCWGHSQKISPGSLDDVGSPLAFYSKEEHMCKMWRYKREK